MIARQTDAECSRLLLVAAQPPPYHGTNMANRALLESAELAAGFRLTHLDTSDHRDTGNLGRFEFENVRLAVTHVLELAAHCLLRRPRVVYILLSQNNLAFFRDGLFVLCARWLGGARVVAHLHGGNLRRFRDRTSPFMRAFIDFCLRRVSQGVVLGECLREQLAPWVREVHVVANGSDCLLEEEPGPKSEDPLSVLYLGSLYRSKGILELGEAIALLAKRPELGQLHFDIAGTFGGNKASGMSAAETERRLRESITGAGMEDRVTFHGLVHGERKHDLLKRSALFVLPSWNEGQPVSLLEAMAAGTPCIATPVGAVPETLREGLTGLLVPARDPASLAGAIASLAQDPARRMEMGRAAREIYMREYTKAAFVERMLTVFRRAAQ